MEGERKLNINMIINMIKVKINRLIIRVSRWQMIMITTRINSMGTMIKSISITTLSKTPTTTTKITITTKQTTKVTTMTTATGLTPVSSSSIKDIGTPITNGLIPVEQLIKISNTMIMPNIIIKITIIKRMNNITTDMTKQTINRKNNISNQAIIMTINMNMITSRITTIIMCLINGQVKANL